MVKFWTIKKNNKGFTLVELIVVLVILAILAAILVPALLGYIDEAKTKQDIINAKAYMTAIQSELANEYVNRKYDTKSGPNMTDNGGFRDGKPAQNVIWKGTDVQKAIKSKTGIDEDPYALYAMVISDGSEHQKYTVYTLVYWSKKSNMPVCYNYATNEWTIGSPFSNDIARRTAVDGVKNLIIEGPLKGQGLHLKGILIYYNENNNNNVKTLIDDINKKVGYTGTINK